MHKKLFALSFFLICGAVFISTQIRAFHTRTALYSAKNRESALEDLFPYGNAMKEIYGYSNRLLSPNEKISGTVATVRERDGFLIPVNMGEENILYAAESELTELNSFCHDLGMKFLYVAYPSKCNAQTTPTLYGIDTDNEEIRSALLSYARENDIDSLDMRTCFEQDGYTIQDIFYKTDHHWKSTAGFYAAEKIAAYMNEAYDWSLNTDSLDEERFTFTTYEDLWFGETGRSLSLSWVQALDDFTQIMPDYPTSITQFRSDGTIKTGDFSLLVDDSGYSGDVDYYDYSAHYSYSNGMGSPVTYHNNLALENGKKILIVKDSFSAIMVPFLSLETSDVTVWDVRFPGCDTGLHDYIQSHDFDIVVLAYTDYWKYFIWNFR